MRGGALEVQRRRLTAQRPGQLAVDGLDDLLRRVEGLGDLLTDDRLAQPLDEALDDLEVDVRLEQGEPDLLQRRVDGLLVEATTPPDLVEGAVESLGEGVEHGRIRCGCRGAALVEGSDGHFRPFRPCRPVSPRPPRRRRTGPR